MNSRLFDPTELVRIAEFLAERDSSEASFRTAVNRTYYAALLASRQFLGVTGSRHIHSRVIGALRRYDQSAGTQLRRLESLRAIADYDIEVQDSLRRDWQQNYRFARRLAQSVLERLQ